MGTVYLLHFDAKFKHARHYIGFTDRDDHELRIAEHRQGRGATLLKHVAAAGIAFNVVRTWQGVERSFERALKNKKHASRLCPVCGECHR